MMNLSKELSSQHIFEVVKKVAETEQLPTYAVGGFVRDLLLGRNVKDIDFVCVGSGIVLAQKVAEILGGLPVVQYKNFGTAMVSFEGKQLEFVGARKESYNTDSRKPTVESGTLEDDLQRRDFTINCLAISLNKPDFGLLIDRSEGLKHLKQKTLVTPLDPNATFSDDPLRMMRAIRFATQLDFDIAPDTFQSIIKNSERLRIVSIERIMEELNKIILSPTPSLGMKLLFTSGLLQIFFPELALMHGVEFKENQGHKDNLYHTLKVLDNLSQVSDDLWLRWAAILHDIAKPKTKRFEEGHGWTFHGHEDLGARMVPKIFRRFKFPMNEPMLFVQKMVRLHMRPIVLASEVTDSALRRLLFEANKDTAALMTLCRADITSKNPEKVNKYLRNFEEVERKLLEVEEKDRIRNFQPPVTGDEIIKLFGITPGPAVGILKEQVKEAILEGEIKNDREEALELLYKLAEKMGIFKIKLNHN